MNLVITRLDYKNRQPHEGFAYLPPANSFDGIDINEIKAIMIGPFLVKAERDLFAAHFPKSYKAKHPQGFANKPNGKINFEVRTYYVYFEFDTFWPNKVTGEKNETAMKRRGKVIEKLKSLLPCA
jgi:hypothetical protein